MRAWLRRVRAWWNTPPVDDGHYPWYFADGLDDDPRAW